MITVIIPTLNEAPNVARLVHGLSREGTVHEVIVVDGGSGDDTVGQALRHGATVIRSPAGRGHQLRRGADAAGGEILLFLHADCVFPTGGLLRIEETLAAAPRLVGGNFRLLFDGDTAFSRRLTEFYAWIRRRGLYYGDSGVFVRREAYDAMGGIRAIAVMEDFDFTRRLEKFGETCCIAAPPLVTSSRRFQGKHPVRIVCGWLVMHALFYFGAPPSLLARLYYGRGYPRARPNT